MKKATLLLSFVVFFSTVVCAQAVLYSFDSITNNIAGDAVIGEAQLFVDVEAVDTNQVRFTFSNTGPAASSIADIYFDSQVSLTYLQMFSSPGVDFSPGATPPNLPSGQNIGFEATSGFDSNIPTEPNGVNPGEYLGILFGASYDEVVAALENGNLRIGIHVQGFDSEGSESFVNNPPTSIPEPKTLLLLGCGLIGVWGFRKKFMK